MWDRYKEQSMSSLPLTSSLALPLLVVLMVLLLSERRDDDAQDTECDTESGTEAEAEAEDLPIIACPAAPIPVAIAITGALTPNNPGAT